MPQLSEKEKETFEIKKWFDSLDVNKDGRVPVKKIAMGNKCIRFNPTDKEAAAIIRELDTDER